MAEKIIYTTKKETVSWAEAVLVWIIIQQKEDGKFEVIIKHEDPKKNIEDWFDLAPTNIAEIESINEAYTIAHDLIENREKWPDGYGH